MYLFIHNKCPFITFCDLKITEFTYMVTLFVGDHAFSKPRLTFTRVAPEALLGCVPGLFSQ